jgi:hypothetical protein
VLAPRRAWYFRRKPTDIIRGYVEDEPSAPLWEMHKQLAEHLETDFTANESNMKPLFRAYQLANLALAGEVIVGNPGSSERWSTLARMRGAGASDTEYYYDALNSGQGRRGRTIRVLEFAMGKCTVRGLTSLIDACERQACTKPARRPPLFFLPAVGTRRHSARAFFYSVRMPDPCVASSAAWPGGRGWQSTIRPGR